MKMKCILCKVLQKEKMNECFFHFLDDVQKISHINSCDGGIALDASLTHNSDVRLRKCIPINIINHIMLHRYVCSWHNIFESFPAYYDKRMKQRIVIQINWPIYFSKNQQFVYLISLNSFPLIIHFPFE